MKLPSRRPLHSVWNQLMLLCQRPAKTSRTGFTLISAQRNAKLKLSSFAKQQMSFCVCERQPDLNQHPHLKRFFGSLSQLRPHWGRLTARVEAAAAFALNRFSKAQQCGNSSVDTFSMRCAAISGSEKVSRVASVGRHCSSQFTRNEHFHIENLCIVTGDANLQVRQMADAKLKSAVGNAAYQFERVILYYLDDLSYLKNLHYYPCEELYLISCGNLTETDALRDSQSSKTFQMICPKSLRHFRNSISSATVIKRS